MATFDWHAERTDLSDLALLEIAPESKDIDLKAVRLYRQGRLCDQMAKNRVDAVILCDPVNIRYATGTCNMQVHTARNAASRYLLLTAKRSIMFEFTGCEHLSMGFETVDESATYVIKENELVGLDTDVAGCHGYFSGFSRTFHSGPDPPTEEQKKLYKLGYEHVHYNMGIIRPGMTFAEYASNARKIPDEYYANRYPISGHGCGLTGGVPVSVCPRRLRGVWL
ncbi:hypothetical protein ACJ41O_001290 [Fusarium nematophilum]